MQNAEIIFIDVPLSCYETDERILYRYALDGTAKDVVYKWDGNQLLSSTGSYIGTTNIMRKKRYYEEDEEIKVECTIKRLSLNTFLHRPETVYTAEENLESAYFGEIFRLMEIMCILKLLRCCPKREIPRRKKIMVTITTGYIIKPLYRIYRRTKIEELQIPDMPKSVHILGVQNLLAG